MDIPHGNLMTHLRMTDMSIRKTKIQNSEDLGFIQEKIENRQVHERRK